MANFDWLEEFSKRIDGVLKSHSSELEGWRGCSVTVAQSSNENFPLRAFAEIKPCEVAATVDLKRNGLGGWVLSSDICTSEGAILAEGPCAAGDLEPPPSAWIAGLDEFLAQNLRQLVWKRIEISD